MLFSCRIKSFSHLYLTWAYVNSVRLWSSQSNEKDWLMLGKEIIQVRVSKSSSTEIRRGYARLQTSFVVCQLTPSPLSIHFRLGCSKQTPKTFSKTKYATLKVLKETSPTESLQDT